MPVPVPVPLERATAAGADALATSGRNETIGGNKGNGTEANKDTVAGAEEAVADWEETGA